MSAERFEAYEPEGAFDTAMYSMEKMRHGYATAAGFARVEISKRVGNATQLNSLLQKAGLNITVDEACLLEPESDQNKESSLYSPNVELARKVAEIQSALFPNELNRCDGLLGRFTIEQLKIRARSKEKAVQLKEEIKVVEQVSRKKGEAFYAMDSLLVASANAGRQLKGEHAVPQMGGNGWSVSRINSKLNKYLGGVEGSPFVLGGQGNDFASITEAEWRDYQSAANKETTAYHQRFLRLVQNTKNIVEKALDAGASHVVIMGRIPYNLDESSHADREQMRKMYKEWAKSYARKNPKVSLYDASEQFPSPLKTSDGVHPSYKDKESASFYSKNWRLLKAHIARQNPIAAVDTASTANQSVGG